MIFETVAPFRGVRIRADVELGEGIVVRLSASAAQVWDLSGILPVTTRSDG